jgi:hypothetical protein
MITNTSFSNMFAVINVNGKLFAIHFRNNSKLKVYTFFFLGVHFRDTDIFKRTSQWNVSSGIILFGKNMCRCK